MEGMSGMKGMRIVGREKGREIKSPEMGFDPRAGSGNGAGGTIVHNNVGMPMASARELENDEARRELILGMPMPNKREVDARYDRGFLGVLRGVIPTLEMSVVVGWFASRPLWGILYGGVSTWVVHLVSGFAISQGASWLGVGISCVGAVLILSIPIVGLLMAKLEIWGSSSADKFHMKVWLVLGGALVLTGLVFGVVMGVLQIRDAVNGAPAGGSSAVRREASR